MTPRPSAQLRLTVAGIWLFYSIRRENHTIGLLLYDYNDADDQIKWLIYHGINSSSVFTLTHVRLGDDPFKSVNKFPSKNQLKFVRYMAGRLWYLPIISLWFIIVIDIFSAIWMGSPVRQPDIRGAFEENRNNKVIGLPDRPWTELTPDEREDIGNKLEKAGKIRRPGALWWRLNTSERGRLVEHWLISAIFSLPLVFMSRKIADFALGTEEVLAEFPH